MPDNSPHINPAELFGSLVDPGTGVNGPVNIDYTGNALVISGRDLHAALQIRTAYKDWFPRMCEYGFAEGEDYSSILSHRSDGLPGKPRTDHQLTINMAKELCMIQRTDIGKQVRQYFLQVEAAWNSPEALMVRALQLAHDRLVLLTCQNTELQPKASYCLMKADGLPPPADVERAHEVGGENDAG